MPTRSRRSGDPDRSPAVPAARRISGPAALLQAVPYLLGFHPRDSLVLVGLRDTMLVVTARLDLVDAAARPLVQQTLGRMRDGGVAAVVAVVYADLVPPPFWPASDDPDESRAPLPHEGLVADLAEVVADGGCELREVLLVAAGRWWSYSCGDPSCCPPDGRMLPGVPSDYAMDATIRGVVPLPDREALAASLDPHPDAASDATRVLFAAARAASSGRTDDREARSVKRTLFAAARASDDVPWQPPDGASVARFAVALERPALRDAVWLAVDHGRLDGRALWRHLALRVPEPANVTPLFLYAWSCWRAGDCALASMALERVLVLDPGYHAADLLDAALRQGVNPRLFPRLRRSA